MNQEVIQNFLNLPGIAGVALMDGRSRPYFCGVEQSLNFQQKEALAQGILQVVETIPDGFESFEFQFAEHQVHIYKLDYGTILMVLTHQDLVYSDYRQTIKNLKAVLREDLANGIAAFRLMAGKVTLSGLPLSSGGIAPDATAHNGNDGLGQRSTTSTSSNSANVANSAFHAPPAPLPAPVDQAVALEAVDLTDVTDVTDVTEELFLGSLQDTVAALNQISLFTAHYLGNHVIVNYWKSTRPKVDWLTGFQIDRSAQFTIVSSPNFSLDSRLTAQQQVWIQEWVAAFIKRCSQVIRNFSVLVDQAGLNDSQKALLLKASRSPN